MEQFIPFGTVACACLDTSRRRLQLEDRPVILHVSQEDTLCPTSLCDALTEQSALARLNASIQTWLRLIM